MIAYQTFNFVISRGPILGGKAIIAENLDVCAPTNCKNANYKMHWSCCKIAVNMAVWLRRQLKKQQFINIICQANKFSGIFIFLSLIKIQGIKFDYSFFRILLEYGKYKEIL